MTTSTPGPLSTRFTRNFGIDHPVVLAPMDQVSDARLASAVTAAGGLGLLGGGYADRGWIEREFAAVTAPVGCGFITWTLRDDERLLDDVLARHPAALFLSFGDPEPYATRVRAAGVPLICQVHDVEGARRALDAGADVLSAQGGEAGGHGTGGRGTFTLVPEIADLLADRAPDVTLLAAGGISDGRGLAAALALGADGALVGTRLWAAREAAVAPAAQQRALSATGDDTVRQHVYDVVRGKAWPAAFSGRVLRNDFVGQWLGREDTLRTQITEELDRFERAVSDEDYAVANVIVGESIGGVGDVLGAGEIVESMVREAATLLRAPAVATA